VANTGSSVRSERRARPEPRPFDPRRPFRLSADHRRALALVFEAFGHRLTTVLATRLRTSARASMNMPEQITYAEFMDATLDPACLAVLSLLPLSGTGVLRLDLDLGMSIVDRLLGGNGGTSGQPTRALSELESNLLRGVLDASVAELGGAFTPLVEIDPRVVRQESKPQLVRGASPESVMVVVDFDIVLGDDTGALTVCMPLSTVGPALESFTVSAPSIGAAMEAASAASVAAHLMDAPIDVSVRFGTVALTSADILDLQVGDVVPLRHPVSHPLTVLASGVPCLAAVPGRRGKRLACMVVESTEHQDDVSSSHRQESPRW
jgi:flagellar motor switch protein FliM